MNSHSPGQVKPDLLKALPALDVIWGFMYDADDPAEADALLCLCSFDTSVAHTTADLYQRGCAPWVVVSGGLAHQADVAATGWERPEADVFAEILERRGVPATRIVRETESQNTGENFKFSLTKMSEAGVQARSLLCVQKPYMLRRTRLTGQVVAPHMQLTMYAEKISVADYLRRDTDPLRTVHVIVGDLHRIMVYPKRGFQSPQQVPASVLEAGRHLIALGFSQHLLAGEPF